MPTSATALWLLGRRGRRPDGRIYLVSLPILGDQWGTDAVVAFGLWVTVLVAAVCYFITGIATPKSRAIS